MLFSKYNKVIKEFWMLLLCVILCACTRSDESSSDGNEKVVNYKTLQNKNGILYSSDGKVPFNGICVSFYDGGLKRDEIHVKAGKRNGLMTIWHTNGQTFRTVRYENGEKHGKQTERDEEGRIRSEACFKHGIKHGLESAWYENGKKSKEANFDNGVEHGTYTEWYIDGQKRHEFHFVHGKKNGLASRWYSNGSKSIEVTLVDGTPHGKFTEWNFDGTIRIEYFYENGRRTRVRVPKLTRDAEQEDGGSIRLR